MSCYIDIEKKESLKTSHMLMHILHENLVDQIINNKLGSNKSIVKFVFELDQNFHGWGVCLVDVADIFYNPEDVGLLISIIEKSKHELFKNEEPKNEKEYDYQVYVTKSLQIFIEDLKKYQQKLKIKIRNN